MRVPTGDCVLEVLDHNDNVMPGWVAVFVDYAGAVQSAPGIVAASGASRWRVMRCMVNSDDKVKERLE